MYNYDDDNCISVSHKKLTLLSRQLQTEAEVTFQWFLDNAMEANPTKFQGLLLKGNKPASDFKVSIRGQEIIFLNRLLPWESASMKISHSMNMLITFV